MICSNTGHARHLEFGWSVGVLLSKKRATLLVFKVYYMFNCFFVTVSVQEEVRNESKRIFILLHT